MSNKMEDIATAASRRKQTKSSNFWYIDVSLAFSDQWRKNLDIAHFKMQIIKAMKQLFGELGAAIPVDVMKYNQATGRAVLRCPTKNYVKLRSSLTLVSAFEGQKCVFKIHKASPSIISLLSNSRTWTHQ
ncbi:hypothetical protein B566_EDAN007682 [Ephemera danica]|nr:hypothetical protein B566_EDAN007682 [Ephemera danica]